MSAFEHNIISELKQGRIVKLGKLGTFRVGISSEGKDTAAEVTSASIVKSRVLFRPSKKMQASLDSLVFTKES